MSKSSNFNEFVDNEGNRLPLLHVSIEQQMKENMNTIGFDVHYELKLKPQGVYKKMKALEMFEGNPEED